MIMKKIRVIYFLIGAFFIVAAGESVKDKAVRQFELVNKKLKGLSIYSMETDYLIYKGHSSVLPVEKTQAVTHRKGKLLFYQQIAEVTTIQNERIRLIKDDSSQAMVVLPVTPDVSAEMNIDINKALQQTSSVNLIRETNTESAFRLNFENKKMEYKAVEVYIDLRKNMLSKISVMYGNLNFAQSADKKDLAPGKMDIVIKSFTENPSIDNKYFSTDKYIRMVNGKWQATEAYKDYVLIDQSKR